ncbi:MAG: hypothetical protein M3516_06845 [Actinomycetota bacterium]|nr:hypothetical protein [Actinomycetota bacterium]
MKAFGALFALVATLILGYFFGYFRAGIAVALFLGILIIGARYLESIVTAPPEPEVADVSGYGLKYVCAICGLELRVEKAAKETAPRHCTEPMELVREDGKPPLRPV